MAALQCLLSKCSCCLNTTSGWQFAVQRPGRCWQSQILLLGKEKDKAWSVTARERRGDRERPVGKPCSIREHRSEDDPEVLLVLALTIFCSPAKTSWLSWAGACEREAACAGGSSLPHSHCPRCLCLHAALAGNLWSPSRARS